MVYRVKRYGKKVLKARRRRFNLARSRFGGKRIAQPVQYFKRVAYRQSSIIANPGGVTFGIMPFLLNDVPNATEFTQLYDQYKIKGVKVKIVPQYDSADLSTANTGQFVPQMLSVIDYDDINPPTSIQDLCQYQNMKMTQANRIHQRYLKPMVNNRVVDGLNSAVSPRRSWIDCAEPNILHHGLKYAITTSPTPPGDPLIKYDVYITYYLAFKNVR